MITPKGTDPKAALQIVLRTVSSGNDAEYKVIAAAIRELERLLTFEVHVGAFLAYPTEENRAILEQLISQDAVPAEKFNGSKTGEQRLSVILPDSGGCLQEVQ